MSTMRSSRATTMSTLIACALLVLPGPRLGHPGSTQAPDLKWDKEQKPRVEMALKVAPQDPVSALFVLKELTAQKHTQEQAAWLDQQIASLTPQSLSRVQRDFNSAKAASDVRGLIITSAIAEMFAKGSINSEAAISEARSKVLSGASAPTVWKITNPTATPIKGNYNEGGVSITPPRGDQLIRVKAHVENIASESDQPYTLWALGRLKTMIAGVLSTDGPSRWLDDSFIYLIGASSEMVSCSHVCRGSGVGAIQVRTGSNKLVFSSKAVKQGEGVDIDVLFSVGKASREYRLFVLSSTPVSLGMLP